MDCYSFTDENSLQADLHLPLLSDSELPIASNIQRSEIIPDPDDIIYTGMTSIELESNLETTEIPDDPFADNLDLSLYTVDKGCDSPKIPSDSTDTDSPPMLLGISPLPRERTPEKDESNSEGKYGCLQKRRRLSTRHSPQQTFQECSQCGKSFSSASALSKHYLTHSHERRHVCRICNKAFKRQDHLSGHLLTHQKNKPYVCMEHGCDKSYCDSRSLRRHYEVQHGLYCQREPWSDTCKDLGSTENALYPQSEHVQASHEGDIMPSSEAHIESLSQRPLLPNRELLRCLTSSLSQKIPCDSGSSGPASVTLQYPTQGHAVSNVLSSPNVCSSDRSGMVRQAKCNAVQREHSAGLNCNVGELCPQINPAHLSVTIPNVSYVENLDTSIMDSLIPTRPQPPPYALEAARPASWPQAVGANHTLSRNETVSSGQQPSQDLVWTNNLATYSGSKGSYSYIVPNSQPSEEVSTNFSSGALHKLDSFAQAFTRQNLDIQSSPSASRPQGENSRVSEFDACGNVFRQLLSYKANLNQWPSFPEQKRQLLQEQYSLHQQHQQQIATSLFTQVYMGEQEAVSLQNQDPFQNHMLQLISDTQYNMCQSQNLVSQSQVTVTQSQHILSQKISGQAQNNETQPHQLLDSGQDFSSCLRQENVPFLQFQTTKPAQQVKSTSPYHTPQVAEPQTGTGSQPKSRSLSECHKKSRKNPFKVQPPPQVPPLVSNDDIAQNQLQGLSEQADNRLLPPCSKKGRSSNKEASFKYCIGGKHSKNTSSRKERQKLDPNCTAPPSQVAMNSFTVQGSLSRSMDDSHQIVQAEDMYNISTTLEEGGDGSSPVSCASQTLEENGESIRCERCQGVFHFLNGLNNHSCSQEVIMGKQHTSEDGNKSQQATDNGIEKMEPGGLFFQYLEDKLSALLLKKPLEEAVVMPLVIPVSVPVKSTTTMKDCKPGKSDNSPITPRKSVTMKLTDLVVSSNDSQAQVSESDRQTVNCTDIPRSKKRRKRARPEPLFIPSPAWSQTGAAPGMVLYQSQMRSPVCLADHLLEMNFHTPPYTPPPMLSPIRQGSGLYFNRVCSATDDSALLHTYTPKGILSCILDSADGFCGISVVKDDSVISIEPHINIGSRFQAEIPQLRDKSLMIDEEPLADLVWKPWGDIETNKVTQKTVTDLLNMACSSVLPGGGTNIELALHCLHDTRGDVLAALEMLLMKGPSRELSHPLRDYHYTGTEKWTCSERKMFNKAICIHNKDFFLMQKMIKFKSVAQCVEYYYTWKKQLKFEWNRTHPPEEEEETRHEANTLGESKETKKLTLIAPQNLGLPCPSGGNREKPRKKISRVTPSPSPSAPCPTGATDKNGKAVTGGDFPCRECAKVFDKVKSRNAHMKCHRQQEEQERRAEIKRSRIHLKVEVEEKPELKDLIAHVDNLQNITAP